jgi:hypothetical protein
LRSGLGFGLGAAAGSAVAAFSAGVGVTTGVVLSALSVPPDRQATKRPTDAVTTTATFRYELTFADLFGFRLSACSAAERSRRRAGEDHVNAS